MVLQGNSTWWCPYTAGTVTDVVQLMYHFETHLLKDIHWNSLKSQDPTLAAVG